MSDTKCLQILFVDDSSNLIESFQDCIKYEEKNCMPPVTIQMTVARHIADAVKNLENQQFDVVLLDIMLPRDEETLKQLEDKETERKKLIKQLLKYSTEEKVDELTVNIAKIRRRIDEIDDIIDNDLQDIEGGYNILRQYLEKRNKEQYDYPIIFISARGQPNIKDKCRKLIKNDKFAWIEKPASEIEILERLLGFCDIKHVEG